MLQILNNANNVPWFHFLNIFFFYYDNFKEKISRQVLIIGSKFHCKTKRGSAAVFNDEWNIMMLMELEAQVSMGAPTAAKYC